MHHNVCMVAQVFTEVFSREHQLMKVDPRKATYLACCLLMRGKMSIADMNRNVTRLKPNLRMVHWNSDGFKLGICSTPPVGMGSVACCGTPHAGMVMHVINSSGSCWVVPGELSWCHTLHLMASSGTQASVIAIS
jgi:hypothetical protein